MISKVIIEVALLNDDEKIAACTLSKAVGADFVKTSTGFASGGATAADVALMRRVVGADMGVKAAGGVRDYEGLKAMVAAGATRVGASAGVKIVQESQGQKTHQRAGGVSGAGYSSLAAGIVTLDPVRLESRIVRTTTVDPALASAL